MKKFSLDKMKAGWFIGDFTPSVIRTKEFEVAIKGYNQGDYEKAHHHKIATEVTVIITGSVRMNGRVFYSGEVILIDKNEVVNFEALEDTITAVVKFPSVNNDKYLNE